MINKDLISASLPVLSPKDPVYRALQLMDDYNVIHLPVVDEEKYLGLIAEGDLLNAENDQELVESLLGVISKVKVLPANHFTDALQLANEYGLAVIPVAESDMQWVGSIASTDLLKFTGHMIGADEPGGIIVLEMDKRSFAFSEICKLVETNDAQITQLNTHFDNNLGVFYVTIKLNKLELSDIVATFQRYDYQVSYFFGEEQYENELRNNYDHLMNYLNL
ncbi:CBS domain-containing protein [Flavihumibacter profundi]|uniref:CBS domain-containing protein n=1 Tax=Flavihumibacter profundi TaxID=2716883 RepID=UPI001CC51688|nr:CBS domain-containing protein [Flavihumibacter profundi]MBZ5857871.1 CBS domain-containing protein [Flavihumibacter profundi]